MSAILVLCFKIKNMLDFYPKIYMFNLIIDTAAELQAFLQL